MESETDRATAGYKMDRMEPLTRHVVDTAQFALRVGTSGTNESSSENEESTSRITNRGSTECEDHVTFRRKHVNDGRKDDSLLTVVNPRSSSRRVSGSRRSSIERRRAQLEAEMEIERQKLEQAQAAAALAKKRLELLQLDSETELSDSDESTVSLKKESVPIRQCTPKVPSVEAVASAGRSGEDSTSRPHARAPPCNDVNQLAKALMNTMKQMGNKESKPSQAPRYINELHPFYGDPSEWIAFRATYYDTERYFSSIENVARLRKSLQGRAREAVKSLLYTQTDPNEIMQAIERRFGRPMYIIKSEIANIDKLPTLSDDGRDLTKFAGIVSNSVNTILQMNKPNFLHSSDISDKIISKMSALIRFKWFEYYQKHEEEPILLSLMSFLNTLADQFAGYEIVKKIENKGKSFDNMSRRTKNAIYVEQRRQVVDESTSESEMEDQSPESACIYSHNDTQIVTSTNKKELKLIKCFLCDGNHYLKKCQQFLKESVMKRWEIVKRLRICFRCLKSNKHRSPDCREKSCNIRDCNKGHHKLLHMNVNSTVEKPERTTSVNTVCTKKGYLKIMPVEIIGPQGSLTTFALLDEGSTVSLIEENIIKKIGATGPEETLCIEGVGGLQLTNRSQRLEVKIRGLHMKSWETLTAYSMERLNIMPQTIHKKDIQGCKYLSRIKYQLSYDEAKPSILIGQDNWHLIVSRKIKSENNNKPVASLTKLGWVLHGCYTSLVKDIKLVNYISTDYIENGELDTMVKEFFSLESLGIQPRRQANDPQQKALSILEATSTRVTDEGGNCLQNRGNHHQEPLRPRGQFETGLLWKNENETMPESRQYALKRLKNLERKFKKDSEFAEEYKSHIRCLLVNKYAEIVTDIPTSPRTWYLPHFAVTHPQKKKIRIVFDAAARTGGKSLNDALLTGPDLLKSLFGVLLRFREGRVAVAADIKEMFLRVKIIERDRDSLRFLWREKETDSPQEYRMCSLIFGAASSPCTAIYIKNRNAKDFATQYPDAVRAIEHNFYMDDYLQSFQSIEEAKSILNQVNLINEAGGFHLRSWASNISCTLDNIPEELKSTGDIHLGSNERFEKILGLRWNTIRDTLNFTLSLRNTPDDIIKHIRKPTKREVTSAVMSVFDPLGLGSPITIQGKILLQNIWRTGIAWDERVHENEDIQWRNWLQELSKLQDLNIPRCISKQLSDGELHMFCDASEKAYAAAVYWRAVHLDGHVEVTLLSGKARVTPVKPISIPRLELQASLMGCRLAHTVEEELVKKPMRKVYWTDSRTVLAWIKSDPRTFKPYVAHRLAEIEDYSRPQEWHWVPTAYNVADDATRDPPKMFNAQHRWFTGPDFLKQKSYLDIPELQLNDCNTNLFNTGEEKAKVMLTMKITKLDIPAIDRLSNWKRLLRAIARFLQSIDIFKSLLIYRKKSVNVTKTVNDPAWRQYNKKKQLKSEKYNYKSTTSNSEYNNLQPLSEKYMDMAEQLLIKHMQKESFPNELKRLSKGITVEKTSRLQRFALELKNEIICLSGRVSQANFVIDSYKTPMVLDGKHRLTKLLIEYYHRQFNHGNHNTVMNEVRQKYWITNLRSLVRSISKSCYWCKLNKLKPQTAPLADLPGERLKKVKYPFTYVGVDYFGPMIVSTFRRKEKRWGVLFTCLTTRAVHLELASSLSADSMILALRRLIARRGTPKVIYSDNGTNFVRANRELIEEFEKMNREQLVCNADSRNIVWKFIPPGAPHMGGVWERLVRSVKVALTAVLYERHPREEILHTLLLEAEHLINSRPLTDVSLYNEDEEALTPNHFLIGRSCGATVFGDHGPHADIGPADWRTCQRLTDHFWARWLKEYLPTLLPRYYIGPTFTNPEIGDIVLIVDSTLPRGTWPRGEIIKVYPGPDRKVRVVDVRTPAGVLRRPTSRLVIITSRNVVRRDISSTLGGKIVNDVS